MVTFRQSSTSTTAEGDWQLKEEGNALRQSSQREAPLTETSWVPEQSTSSSGRGPLRALLLVSLLAAAAFALLGHPSIVASVRAGRLAPEWLSLGPVLYLCFVVVATIDAVHAAKRRGHWNGRSLLQVLLALGFVAFLVPQAYGEYRARKAPPTTSSRLVAELVRHRDARVRAMAIDLAGYRAPLDELREVLLPALADRDPMVRQAALEAFQRRYDARDIRDAGAALSRLRERMEAPLRNDP
ncbi:MAG: HEAT repeat domain-containing protein [Myxococcota bacterium]